MIATGHACDVLITNYYLENLLKTYKGSLKCVSTLEQVSESDLACFVQAIRDFHTGKSGY